MSRPRMTVTTRWLWAWQDRPFGNILQLALGLSIKSHRTWLAPHTERLDLVKVWIHLLAGALTVTIQLRPLAVTDWSQAEDPNA